MMIKEIVKLVFQQAKNETPNVSKTGLSKHISKKIEETDNSKIYSYKTFTRYYDKYIANKDGIIDHPQSEIIEQLCKYLGYENYQDFVGQKKAKHTNEETLVKENKVLVNEIEFITKTKEINKTYFLNKNLIEQILFSIVIIILFNSSWKDQECLICLEDHYKNLESQNMIYNKLALKKMNTTDINTSITFSEKNICYDYDLYIHKKLRNSLSVIKSDN